MFNTGIKNRQVQRCTGGTISVTSFTTIKDRTHLMGERVYQLLLESIGDSSIISHEVIPMHVNIQQSSQSK